MFDKFEIIFRIVIKPDIVHKSNKDHQKILLYLCLVYQHIQCACLIIHYLSDILSTKIDATMKKNSLLFLLILLYTQPIFSQNFWDAMTDADWQGTGTLLGAEADFSMKWTWVLDNKFLKLEFQNKQISRSGLELVLQAHAYYQPKRDLLFEGTWFDTRGVTFPVTGTIQDSTFTVLWGSPETEQGKKVYTIVSQKEATDTDYFLQGDNYMKFGDTNYQSKNQF